MKPKVIFLILRLLAAIILAQTLFFKFSAAEESVALFSKLSNALKGDASMEPLMRIGSGVVELIAVVLLLMRKPAAIASGALIAFGTMLGAVFAHVTVLGTDDSLFPLALVVLVASCAVLFRYRGSLPYLGRFT